MEKKGRRKTERKKKTEMLGWKRFLCCVVGDDAVVGMACGGQNGQPQG